MKHDEEGEASDEGLRDEVARREGRLGGCQVEKAPESKTKRYEAETMRRPSIQLKPKLRKK